MVVLNQNHLESERSHVGGYFTDSTDETDSPSEDIAFADYDGNNCGKSWIDPAFLSLSKFCLAMNVWYLTYEPYCLNQSKVSSNVQ